MFRVTTIGVYGVRVAPAFGGYCVEYTEEKNQLLRQKKSAQKSERSDLHAV